MAVRAAPTDRLLRVVGLIGGLAGLRDEILQTGDGFTRSQARRADRLLRVLGLIGLKDGILQ
jgi:hypothetical protein